MYLIVLLRNQMIDNYVKAEKLRRGRKRVKIIAN